MTFRVITGESPRLLLDQLDAALASDPLPPLTDEVVIVQSLGMERWLRQQLARRRGVAASLHMPFPAAFCRELAKTLQAAPPDPAFDEQAMLWRIHALLLDDARAGDRLLAPLQRLLATGDPVARFQLARQITARFDEYRLYRPDLLMAWDTGLQPPASPHEAWQWHLWRQLASTAGPGDGPPRHFARWFRDTVTRLESGAVDRAHLPPRVALFGISTMAPLFVRLLQALAQYLPVTCFVFTPSAHGWHSAAHRHPLEEAFGLTTRELLGELTDTPHLDQATGSQPPRPTDSWPMEHLAIPTTASRVSLLHRLQWAIRAGSAATGSSGIEPDGVRVPGDRSLLVHDCHSPRRELEVLRDQLLDAFAADDSLRPHDVLVMVPDVERYAPLVNTALAQLGSDGVVLPVRVADRSLARDVAPAQALLLLLALVGSRLPHSQVVDFLSLDVVRTAAALSTDELETALQRLTSAQVRWGADATHRGEGYDGPAFAEGSWRWALDRLLAGYAMGPVEDPVMGGVPSAGDTAQGTRALGLLAEWTETLLTAVQGLEAPRTLPAWGRDLAAAYRGLVRGTDDAQSRAIDRVAAVCEQLTAHSGEVRIPFAVVRTWVEGQLGDSGLEGGFLAGGITVCAMKPMRAVPFRFIAILGLDDRSFPRQDRRPVSDLITHDPRRGDRNPRADDRQLFLDTLLCAEERLHLSWVGRSERTNRPVAPSVVVAELLDHLDRHVREPVVVTHPLQPFSPAYFASSAESTGLFSYHPDWGNAVRAAVTRHEPPPFHPRGEVQAAPAPPVVINEREPINLADLVSCWRNPARFHCRDVLGLQWPYTEEQADDDEPVVVDRFVAADLQRAWLPQALRAPLDADRLTAAMQGSGRLPPAAVGAVWAAELREQLVRLVAHIGPVRFTAPRTIDVLGPSWHLTGRLDSLTEAGPLVICPSGLWMPDQVAAWIAHLVWSAVMSADGQAPPPGGTRLIALDEGSVVEHGFAWEPDAMACLDVLVAGYRQACQRPLPYFPKAAESFRKAHGAKTKTDPALAARRGYEGSDRLNGDVDDRHVQLLWRGHDPLADQFDAFTALTNGLWVPMEAAKVRRVAS